MCSMCAKCTCTAIWGACRDDIVQKVGHEESGTLHVAAHDWHACLEHGQQLACRHRHRHVVKMTFPPMGITGGILPKCHYGTLQV